MRGLVACRIATAGLASIAPALALGVGEQAQPRAVVSLVTGTARVDEMTRATRTLRLFDWLSEGTWISLEPGVQVTLAFADGRRWRVTGRARIQVQADGLRVEGAEAEPLQRVPTIPLIAGVGPEVAGGRAGAIRIRQGERMTCLYPGPEARTLPDHTTLSFGSNPRASSYRATVEDEAGRIVFSAETRQTTIELPSGVLQPGRRYYWSVRTLQSAGPAATGESVFATLSVEELQQRDAFLQGMTERSDAESQGLMAEVDRRLGLLSEARRGFVRAKALTPHSEGLEAAIVEIESAFRAACED